MAANNGKMDPKFIDVLRANFGVKKPAPVAPVPMAPAPIPQPPAAPAKDLNPVIGLRAQKIYQTPDAKNAPGKTGDTGTGPAMDITSKWDKGNR